MTEVSNGYFPDYDVQWDYAYVRRYKTRIRESRTGKEQRKRSYPSPGSAGTGRKGGYARISASSDAFTPAERQTVADFLDAMEGAFRTFYLFRSDRDNFSNYQCGSVAAALSIVIPFKDFSATSVTVDNVSVGFTTTNNIGTGGETRVNFSVPQTGVVRVTGRGRERLLVRSENDEVVQNFIANVVNDNVVFQLAFIERK